VRGFVDAQNADIHRCLMASPTFMQAPGRVAAWVSPSLRSGIRCATVDSSPMAQSCVGAS
jgi:hypothetical protein